MLDQCKWWILPARYEFLYTYDKVGNRTVKYEFFVTNSVGSGLKWTCTYNGLNQLTQQNKYSADSLTLDRKWLYTYDADGNLTTKEKQTSAGVKEEKWVYTWNPRNQMTLAEKFTGTNDTYAGKVAYRYCLSCDSVLSERIEYSPTVSTTITSRKRYEYDGLNLMRMDERYDTAGGAIGDQDPWRTLEVSTHKPGSLGALIGKRVYTHTNNDATPDATNDYTYTYDAIGNVLAIYNANSTGRGNELYYFTQDAFGNELSGDANIPASNRTNLLGGATWSTARTAGITEHQTGKWIDPFTGLYFFHARWYDSGVGRFVGKDPIPQIGLELNHASKHFSSCSMLCYKRIHSFTYKDRTFRFSDYSYVHNCPTMFIDPDGNIAIVIGAGVVVYIVGSFLNAINCEAILKKLVNCVEWRLKRPLSNHEIMLLSGDIISNNLICKCLPFSTTLMDHVRNHITYPDLQPIGCTNETADQILYYYGWK